MTATFLLLLCGSLAVSANPSMESSLDSRPIDTLVVCAPGLEPTLRPWLNYRRSQGYQISVTTDTQSAERIQLQIRQAARRGGLRSVVLVGDVHHADRRSAFHLPAPVVKAEVISAWGPETELAADNRYVDLDGDFSPDLAIGRLPASDPQELSVMVKKIIAYEQDANEGRWRRKINLVAGVGGFGVVADAVIETATRSFIRRGIPDGYETQIAYASWRSPYCPDPRTFQKHVVDQLSDGCLCWVYVGHGQRTELDWVRVPIGIAPILRSKDVGRVQCRAGSPIAVFLSCYGAAFDGKQDCLTEELLQQPGGPVAALGGSRVTMPYGMAVLSQALMKEMFQQRRGTLGEVLLHAKRNTMSADVNRQHRLLASVARAMSPQPANLLAERREHVDMFHLLGDPLLQLHHPSAIEVDSDRSAAPGERLTVRCRSELAGRCVVELACRRGRFTFQPEPRHKFDGSHEGMRKLDDVFAQANNDVYAREQVTALGKPFQVQLKVPLHASGPCTIRVFIEQSRGVAGESPSNTSTESQVATASYAGPRLVDSVDAFGIGASSVYIAEGKKEADEGR